MDKLYRGIIFLCSDNNFKTSFMTDRDQLNNEEREQNQSIDQNATLRSEEKEQRTGSELHQQREEVGRGESGRDTGELGEKSEAAPTEGENVEGGGI